MDTGVLFYEIDPPYIHEDPVRGEYYIYCAVPRIRNYVVPGRPFQYPIRTAYFNPDSPYDFPLSWLHPGGPGIPHPEEQMPPPPDHPPPPEPSLLDEPIPAQLIHEAPPAPFVLDEWGVLVLPPELDPLPEPIEPPVFDEQQGHEYDQIMEARPPSPDYILFGSYPFMVPVASSGSSAITPTGEEDEEEENPEKDPNFIVISSDSDDDEPGEAPVGEHHHSPVKKEVTRLLDADIIYPISDSKWVSPVQVVPKKSGITTVKKDDGEMVTKRVQNAWRVCIDYRRLNVATRKDHYPLPFIDQMLDRLAGKSHYCFLNGFTGYFQIHITPEDQKKTTFTCPFGTFAYKRMPFGLCNAPATFQRCMTSVFSDLMENCLEVFMDDFSIYGTSFDYCLDNLAKVLARCVDTNLLLNFEKCHFMVQQGIVLGHVVSHEGISVDPAKVDVITTLP
ncbi:phosphatase and actin regulator 4B-like, partial [Arachis ipaensis]|uniref:phosphatase and actin regulator 4B-like n=1 Tax=Arachis ipaensis TaxID=130454 RepID=UPI000A2B2935